MTTLERPQPKLSMADKAARIDAICEKARILPVITIAREEDILPLADAGAERAASTPDHEPCAAGFGKAQDSVDFRSIEADHPECRTGIR